MQNSPKSAVLQGSKNKRPWGFIRISYTSISTRVFVQV
jgi:hypothetical protein